jgi:mRNA interferase RelE/StbE
LAWRIEFTPQAAKQLRKLDRTAAQRIANYLKHLVEQCQRPDERGSALSGDLARLWRYRVGDYRVICELQEEALLVLVVRIGHRSTVYD